MRQNQKLYFYRLLTWWWPDSSRLMRLKCFLLRWCGVHVGKNVQVASNAVFSGDGSIEVGDNCMIRSGCFIHSSIHGKIVLEGEVLLARGVHVEAEGLVEIGFGSRIMHYTMLAANGESTLRIGENCQIAHFVSLKTSHHAINTSGKCIGGGDRFSDISIGNGCWICAGAIIIPGVDVGEHCVVAAGAVVTHGCEPYSLYAGVPAKLVKHYLKKEG